MTTPETAAEIREQLRGMALSLATGSGPLVEPSAFDAALDAYRAAVRAEAFRDAANGASLNVHSAAAEGARRWLLALADYETRSTPRPASA